MMFSLEEKNSKEEGRENEVALKKGNKRENI
jgi:hypothetical protein